MLRRFASISPQILTSPVYRLDTRRIAHAHDHRAFRRYTLQRILIALLAVELIILLYVTLPLSPTGDWESIIIEISIWGLLLGILLTVPFDFASLLVSLNSWRTSKSRCYFDLLQLTPLEPKWIIKAKYDAALVRAWFHPILLGTFRLSLVALVVLMMFYQGFFTELLLDAPIEGMILYILLGWYIFEVFGHYRAVVAIGLLQSRRENVVVAVLFGLFQLLAFWIGQMLIMVVFPFLVIILMVNLLRIQSAPLFFAILTAGVIVAVRFYQDLIEHVCLRRSMNSVFKE